MPNQETARMKATSPGRQSLVLKGLIRLSQHIGRGNSKISFNVLQETFVDKGPDKRTESDHEATGLDEFLDRFDPPIIDKLKGRTILDYGCGYGGKAVELARRLPTSKVIGIEPHHKKIDKANDFAQRKDARNTQFLLCTQSTVPLPDQSVDAIVCHDVLEHVSDPGVVLREMHRVLRDGGKAYIIFPPYDGPVSHHLDFITSMPGLHWLFSPDTIMATINAMLSSDYGKRFKTPPQPAPTYSELVRKRVLPSLNGLGTKSFRNLTEGLFRIERIDRITLVDKLTKLGFTETTASKVRTRTLKLMPAAADHLTMTMAIILERL